MHTYCYQDLDQIKKEVKTMKADLTKKERFEKAMRKALEEGRSDYLGIKEGTTLAVLDSSELSKIKNAFIIIQDADSVKKWTVEDSQIKKCPAELHICIKNSKALLGCIGDHNEESSFFEFRGEEDASSNKIIIFGAAEIYECSCVFYFNETDGKRIVFYEYSDGRCGNDLYDLVSGLQKIEEGIHESSNDNNKGLLWEKNSSSNKLWTD